MLVEHSDIYLAVNQAKRDQREWESHIVNILWDIEDEARQSISHSPATWISPMNHPRLWAAL